MSQTDLIRVRVDGAERTISFSPDHLNDSSTAEQIAGHLNDLVAADDGSAAGGDPPQTLNLDFNEIDSLSSAALNQLIGINRQARRCDIRLVLTNVQESVRDLFELTRLERSFELTSPEEMALTDPVDE